MRNILIGIAFVLIGVLISVLGPSGWYATTKYGKTEGKNVIAGLPTGVAICFLLVQIRSWSSAQKSRSEPGGFDEVSKKTGEES